MSSTPPIVNTVEVAAAPSLIAAIQALMQFETDIGTNVAVWPVTIPAAKMKLLGNLALLLPGLETSELTAVEGLINNVGTSWITKLQTLSAKPA